MAISDRDDSDFSCSNSITTPLIEDVVRGSVDFRGLPARRSKCGSWRSAIFIIAGEVGEKFTYFGIYSNLITYLTEQLGESVATAAENVNTWNGVTLLMPLLGAFVADSYLGRYRTVLVSSLLYILGLGLLTLSAVLTSARSMCTGTENGVSCYSAYSLELLFFFSLYMTAFAQGGHKPCLQAFGADQFDGQDPNERKAKSSFFNWWYFSLSVGIIITLVVVVYIQENLSWTLGFGIPCCVMTASLLTFLLGSRTYRYSNIKEDEKNPFGRIIRVIARAMKNRRITADVACGEEAFSYHQSSHQFKCLNNALLAPDGLVEDKRKLCSVKDVEDTKVLLRIVPIWISSLIYGIVFAQGATFFTKQGATMDREIISGFKIPAATLQTFTGIAIITILPIYDRILVPLARSLTGKPSGITVLQRIRTGMLISALSMVVAAIVEKKRLTTAEEYGLVNNPNATIPMSVLWLVPQYLIFGTSDIFTIVGLQEFFYDQVPNELRSLGVACYYSVTGVGSILSSLLVAVIDKATRIDGHKSWFDSNLNEAHLDYFYWLLAGLSVLGFISFFYFASSFSYRKQ